MGQRSTDEPPAEWLTETLPPEVEARMQRNISVMLGLVPLPEMTQAEVDWVFRTATRWAE